MPARPVGERSSSPRALPAPRSTASKKLPELAKVVARPAPNRWAPALPGTGIPPARAGWRVAPGGFLGTTSVRKGSDGDSPRGCQEGHRFGGDPEPPEPREQALAHPMGCQPPPPAEPPPQLGIPARSLAASAPGRGQSAGRGGHLCLPQPGKGRGSAPKKPAGAQGWAAGGGTATVPPPRSRPDCTDTSGQGGSHPPPSPRAEEMGQTPPPPPEAGLCLPLGTSQTPPAPAAHSSGLGGPGEAGGHVLSPRVYSPPPRLPEPHSHPWFHARLLFCRILGCSSCGTVRGRGGGLG